MLSTVLLTRSIRRLRSALVKPSRRMTRETMTCSRPNAQRHLAMIARSLLLRDVRQLLGKLNRLLVVLLQLVDASRNIVQAVGDDLFRDLLLVEENNFLDGADPRFRSSPIAMISRMTMGERESAFRTRSWPRSMRLAISTSPSRVSSGTVPISRRYMRTGSLVFSSVPGREIQFHVLAGFDLSSNFFSARFGSLEHIDPLRTDGGKQVLEIVGGMHVVRDEVIHLVIGEITLLFAHIDQFFDIVVLVF